MKRIALALAGAALLSGCAASPGLYKWGGYGQSLRSRYVENDPAEARATIEAVIVEAEGGGGRVPPGVYADYGFLVYQGGDKAKAVEYFRKEAAAFPEAAPLMTKLIARVNGQPVAATSLQPTASVPSPAFAGAPADTAEPEDALGGTMLDAAEGPRVVGASVSAAEEVSGRKTNPSDEDEIDLGGSEP